MNMRFRWFIGCTLLLMLALPTCATTSTAHDASLASSTPMPTATASAHATTAATATATSTIPSQTIWHPKPHTSLQWQLSGLPVNLSVQANVYDIDAFDNSASVVAALHARGRKAICYIDVGSWEDYRPDANKFPKVVLGKVYQGYPDERWLDIRRIDLLGPIMLARLNLCKSKGFDAVEPDNIDGYTNDTGFPLTYQDQLRYNIWVANAAHARGLSIGLKNDLDQIPDLLKDFDWALSEQCFEYDECDQLVPFIHAGKVVWDVEYNIPTSAFCARANALNFDAMKKDVDLTAYRVACR